MLWYLLSALCVFLVIVILSGMDNEPIQIWDKVDYAMALFFSAIPPLGVLFCAFYIYSLAENGKLRLGKRHDS